MPKTKSKTKLSDNQFRTHEYPSWLRRRIISHARAQDEQIPRRMPDWEFHQLAMQYFGPLHDHVGARRESSCDTFCVRPYPFDGIERMAIEIAQTLNCKVREQKTTYVNDATREFVFWIEGEEEAG